MTPKFKFSCSCGHEWIGSVYEIRTGEVVDGKIISEVKQGLVPPGGKVFAHCPFCGKAGLANSTDEQKERAL